MLIRIIQCSQGCNFQPGQLLKMGDKQAIYLIEQGYAERADEMEIYKPPEVSRRPLAPNPFMLPPRWIAPDGFVAKDEEELKAHKCD